MRSHSYKEMDKILDERDGLLLEVVKMESIVKDQEEEIARLRDMVNGMAARIHAQSELLSKKAERGNGHQ